MTKAALGGRAMRWAITRVKPEQASKVQLRMPTRRDRGRQYGRASRSTAPVRSAGVVGTARRKGDAGNVGDPLGWSFFCSIAAAMRTRWESERVIVLLKPGNAGGGKDPCFRHAFEEVEDR